MAEIVMAYSASHAPMMTADPGSAPKEKADSFFGALEEVRTVAKEKDVQAIVMMSGEHFTNFFLDGLPQIAVGLDDGSTSARPRYGCRCRRRWCRPTRLAAHVTAKLIELGHDPALSYGMKIDHGFMTVYYWLDPRWNCRSCRSC